MTLCDVLSPNCIKVDLESEDKDELLEEMLEIIIAENRDIDRDDALTAIVERENKMSTGILPGIAVPHAKCSSTKKIVAALGISKKGIEFNSIDGKPVHLVLMILSSLNSAEQHLRVLEDSARILSRKFFLDEILQLKSVEEVYAAITTLEP